MIQHSSTHSPVLVLGGHGMLGRAVAEALGSRAVALAHADCDIADRDQVHAALEAHRPVAVVNCAAWTDVDGAETHPGEAHALNADAVATLGELACARGLHFITFSTDYVFNGEGEQPFPEEAPASALGPLQVYGRAKLAGELRLRALDPEWRHCCIVRTQWLYGAGGRNFIDTIARLAAEREVLRVVDDQVGAPTWTRDVAAGVGVLLDHRATGIYHVVNSGFASWHAVARHVVEHLGLLARVEPCSSEEYPRPARRPSNSRLAQGRYVALAGAPLREWRVAASEYLDSRVI